MGTRVSLVTGLKSTILSLLSLEVGLFQRSFKFGVTILFVKWACRGSSQHQRDMAWVEIGRHPSTISHVSQAQSGDHTVSFCFILKIP